jgi:hypothetical protein
VIRSEVRMTERVTYSTFEIKDLFICESIGLGNNRNQVNLGVETTHEFNIELLETEKQAE